MQSALEVKEARVHDFHTKLEQDDAFRAQLQKDVLGTLRQAGLSDFADAAEKESERLHHLADRYRQDAAFRASVDVDPLAALAREHIPHFAASPFLERAGAPAEVIERTSSDVEAHLLPDARVILAWSIVVVALGVLLFAGEATFLTDPASAPSCTRCF